MKSKSKQAANSEEINKKADEVAKPKRSRAKKTETPSVEVSGEGTTAEAKPQAEVPKTTKAKSSKKAMPKAPAATISPAPEAKVALTTPSIDASTTEGTASAKESTKKTKAPAKKAAPKKKAATKKAETTAEEVPLYNDP